MDAEKVAPLASEYEFMVKKTLKKTFQIDEIRKYPLKSVSFIQESYVSIIIPIYQ